MKILTRILAALGNIFDTIELVITPERFEEREVLGREPIRLRQN